MKFTKMQGIGNDYIYINNLDGKIKNENELAVKLSDRHFGIGSDGIILICKSSIADFKMRIINSDGSEAEMCGNGIRCVGKYVYDKGLTNKTELSIETLAGIKYLTLTLEDNKVSKVTVDMGEPILEKDKIPVKFSSKDDNRKIEFVKIDKEIEKEKINLTCVSMGNPHAVCFMKNVDSLNIEKYGKRIENDDRFPNKTNTEFVEIINKNTIKMRVWERGVGETLACGTGACASVCAAILNNYTNREVKVMLLGGTLEIKWDKDKHIYMTGPAVTVFEGEI